MNSFLSKQFIKIKRLFGKAPQKRSFQAGLNSRLTADWVFTPVSMDTDLWRSLKNLRARSRELTKNDDYAKQFIRLIRSNVVGPDGMTLQNKAKNADGSLDERANFLIQEAFGDWSYKKNASVTRKLSWIDLQRLFIATVARDGEALVRIVRPFNNSHQISLQFLEVDHLDEYLNVPQLENGNQIRMGVELNPWREPVAYYLLAGNPGDYNYLSGSMRYNRIPASEIIHAFIQDSPEQTRGLPWMVTAMIRMKMIGGYEEAEIIAARVGACKMGFFTSPDGQGYAGDGTDSNGNTITEAEPGTFEQLPDGVDFASFNPDHPAGNFAPFMKAILRGISSGLGVPYTALSSDLEGVSYSSIRQGVIQERDEYKTIQTWMIEQFCEPVFEAYLDTALLIGKIPLPYSKFSQFNKPVFHPRGWQWVDPQSDVNANLVAVQSGFKSRTEVCAEQGKDFIDVVSQLAKEKDLADSLGVTLEPIKTIVTEKTAATPDQSITGSKSDQGLIQYISTLEKRLSSLETESGVYYASHN